jgi:hypothetical protein
VGTDEFFDVGNLVDSIVGIEEGVNVCFEDGFDDCPFVGVLVRKPTGDNESDVNRRIEM